MKQNVIVLPVGRVIDAKTKLKNLPVLCSTNKVLSFRRDIKNQKRQFKIVFISFLMHFAKSFACFIGFVQNLDPFLKMTSSKLRFITVFES